MRRLILVSLLVVLQSCSLFGRQFVSPEVQVVNLMFTEMTIFETSAVFELRVDNENPYPLDIEGGTYRLYLNDTFVGKGFDSEGFRVERLSSTTFPVTVSISNLSMITKFQNLVTQPKLSYRVESTLYPRNSFRTVKSVNAGEFDFSGMVIGSDGKQLRKFN
jgi:LEA14-like dessication related protein